MHIFRWFLLGLVTACVGCTVLSSTSPLELDKQGSAPRGVYYTLPKGVVDAVLRVDPQNAKFLLSLENPQFVPDQRHGYYLRYRPLPNYKDDVTVETSAKSFLKLVKSDTTDKTPDIVVNIAKALSVFGAFEAAPLPAGIEVLAKITFDPLVEAERLDVISKIDIALENYLVRVRKACGYFAGTVDLTKRERKRKWVDASGDVCARVLPKETSSSDRSLRHYECELVSAEKQAEAFRRKLRTADVWKRSIANTIKETEKKLVAKLPADKDDLVPDFKCEDRPPADSDPKQSLCAQLRLQRAADLHVKELQDKVDDIETKIKAIETQRAAEKQWCGQFKEMKSQSARIALHRYRVPGGDLTAGARRTAAPAAPDCSAGLCYRPREPMRIEYGLGPKGGEYHEFGWQSLHVDLPNDAELIGIDITRAFFVQKVQEIHFDDNGFLNTVKVKKPSELVAVSKLPLDVVDAVSKGLTVRVEMLNAQRDLALKEAQLLEAQAKLEEARLPLESGALRTESAPARARARGPAAVSNRDVLR